MMLVFPGSTSAERVSLFQDDQYFHYPEKVKPLSKRPIIQGLDIVTQILGNYSSIKAPGFQARFHRPIHGDDAVSVKYQNKKYVGECKNGNAVLDVSIISRAETRIDNTLVGKGRFNYDIPYNLRRETLLSVFNLPNTSLICPYFLLSVGLMSGAFIQKFNNSLHDSRESSDPEVEFCKKIRENKLRPIFISVNLQSTGFVVDPSKSIEIYTRVLHDQFSERLLPGQFQCQQGPNEIYRGSVTTMILHERIINSKFLKNI